MVKVAVSALLLLTLGTDAFQSPTTRAAPKAAPLFALTERQLQFWEDVEAGLDDVEKVYGEIPRIRKFGQYARGEIPAPEPSGPKHQPCEEYVEGLTANAFWDASNEPDLFPWAKELEEKSDVIIEEFQQILGSGQLFASDSAWQNQVMGTGWSAIRLQRLGVWNTDNCRKFPKTYELLKDLNIPFAVRGVCFARQEINSGVKPHSDGRNFILTSHLGLQVPEGCWMKSGEEEKSWEVGKLTTLDTSFEHSTGNPTDKERHVLIIDYWHPQLNEAERAALEFVYDLRNKFESGQVPFRRPRSVEPEGELFGGIWKAITGNEE